MTQQFCERSGKICHTKKSTANRKIKGLNRTGRSSKGYIGKLHAYRCVYCSFYHIGHSAR